MLSVLIHPCSLDHVEAATSKAAQVATALPGWRYTVEAKKHRLPERRPLHRSRLPKQGS